VYSDKMSGSESAIWKLFKRNDFKVCDWALVRNMKYEKTRVSNLKATE
jgi:hypothetical protein